MSLRLEISESNYFIGRQISFVDQRSPATFIIDYDRFSKSLYFEDGVRWRPWKIELAPALAP